MPSATVADRFFDRFVGEGSARDLAVARIAVFGCLLGVWLSWDVTPYSELPVETRFPKGIMKRLYAVGLDPGRNWAALAAVRWATGAVLAAAAMGLWSRWTVPLGAAAGLYYNGLIRDETHYFHTGMAPTYMAAALAFFPCGDAWSLDALLRRSDPAATRPAASAYGRGRFVCRLILALLYLLAGLSKLRNGGLEWASADNLRGLLVGTTLRPHDAEFTYGLWAVHAPDGLLTAAGVGTLVLELLYPTALFFRAVRPVLMAAALLFHLGTMFLQNITFFDFMVLQVVWIDWNAGARRATGVEPATPPLEPAPTSRPTSARNGRYLAIYGAITAAALAVWALRIEYFPVSTWAMFSGTDRSGIASYHKVLVRYEDGARAPVRLREFLAAARDPGYNLTIRLALTPYSGPARALLDACLQSPRNGAEGRPRAVGIDVEEWKWDFRNFPDDPNRGELTRRFSHPPATAPR